MIFFLNSTDRVYNDEELNAVTELLFSDGVLNTQSDTHALWEDGGDFYIEPQGGNMNITAKPGMAVATAQSDGDSQRIFIKETTELTATVSNNATAGSRNDAVVLRIDQSVIDADNLNEAGDNAVTLVVVAGSDENPLTDAEITTALSGDPYIRLADVLVEQSETEITDSDITDVRELPKVTRSSKLASDSFTFYELDNDPDDPDNGQVWYNITEGILKFYDGTNTIALQTQTFDWGYYPPNGEYEPVETDPVAENDSSDGLSHQQSSKSSEITNTEMAGQLFEMPNVSQPYFRVKMADPELKGNVKFVVYSVDGNNDPNAEVEDLGTIDRDDIPTNDYVDLFTTATYNPGTKYLLIAISTQDADGENFYAVRVQISDYENDDVFLGNRNGVDTSSATNDPTSLTWTTTDDHQFVMSIADISKQAIGETDSSSNFHEISQSFVSTAQDLTGFTVTKGESVGSPTGFVRASLYQADNNNDPTGNVLNTVEISESDWQAASDGDELTFEFNYDELVVGERYVVKIETENNSNTDNYRLYFVESNDGGARRYTTSEDWVDAGGDIVLKTKTSSVNKIPVTNSQGMIDDDLIARKTSRVQEYTDTATPDINVNTHDAVVVTALDQNITSVSVSGLPSDFRVIKFRITDAGTGRSITWGSDFEAKGVALPSSVTVGQTLTSWFEYDAVTEKWGCILSVETS